jgi:hypothetical protein
MLLKMMMSYVKTAFRYAHLQRACLDAMVLHIVSFTSESDSHAFASARLYARKFIAFAMQE